MKTPYFVNVKFIDNELDTYPYGAIRISEGYALGHCTENGRHHLPCIDIPASVIGGNGRAINDPYNKTVRLSMAAGKVIAMLVNSDDAMRVSFVMEYLCILRALRATLDTRNENVADGIIVRHESLLRMRKLLASINDPQMFIFGRHQLNQGMEDDPRAYFDERHIKITILPLIQILEHVYCWASQSVTNTSHLRRMFYATIDAERALKFAPQEVVHISTRECQEMTRASVMADIKDRGHTIQSHARKVLRRHLAFEVAIYLLTKMAYNLDLPQNDKVRGWIPAFRGLVSTPYERISHLVNTSVVAEEAGDIQDGTGGAVAD